MRNLFFTLPDRLKLAWRAARGWWHALFLRWIDRFLARRGEERVPILLDFEDLPVLYDEADIPALFDEPGGWSGNPWPERAETVDYGIVQVL
jgi:hypothetical protein